MGRSLRTVAAAVGVILTVLGILLLIFVAGAGTVASLVVGVGLALLAYSLLGARIVEVGPVKFQAASPPSGRWHTSEVVGQGDGSRTRFRTTTPFVAGTLGTAVDGTYQPAVWSDPASGEFELGFAPRSSERVFATWQER